MNKTKRILRKMSKLSAEAAAHLQDGINLVLNRWAALRMAVENQWGGFDTLKKSQQLGVDLFNRLTQSKEKVYIEDVEEMLEEFMLYLNTEIDDGSIEEIAEKMMVMHEECLEGNFGSIVRLKQMDVPNVSYVRKPGMNDEDSDEEEDEDNNSSEMDVDTSQYQPTPSQKSVTNEPSSKGTPEVEDGWIPVPSRRNKGRRN